ncbi:DUF4262 domain-containing protein [Actinoplanes derwentensis]|uniref:DUF4262 domain-containing protein n=1 Tax=Actinoplanes derwentensis TaxID=113562 RepID=A0A1H1UL83_9ACTN|nr:DUF4262 domain-containing protein [Actinoplanes derwentensis]GID88098.1 hypothetical protein Ade03nite_70220 [Actinoplanes derwentensis]SDS73235.1 protein of unknown function [Actinoplanes derwentensis]
MPFEPDPDRRDREQLMKDRGWGIVILVPNAGDRGPLFSYTVGLTSFGRPELLAYDSSGRPLEELGRLVAEGRVLADGEQAVLSSGRVLIRDVATWSSTGGPAVAREAYGRDGMRLQQVLFPDSDGRFPGENSSPNQPVLPHVSEPIPIHLMTEADFAAEAAARVAADAAFMAKLAATPPKRMWWWPPSWF